MLEGLTAWPRSQPVMECAESISADHPASLFPPATLPVAAAAAYTQCGFVAQAPRPYTTFQPFLVPQAVRGQCFAAQPFAVRPQVGPIAPVTAGANSQAFTNAGAAKAFADACAQAFGELPWLSCLLCS